MLLSLESSVRPGIVMVVMLMLPPSGMPPEITDACVTPGVLRDALDDLHELRRE